VFDIPFARRLHTWGNVQLACIFLMQHCLSCPEVQPQQAPTVWLAAHVSQGLPAPLQPCRVECRLSALLLLTLLVLAVLLFWRQELWLVLCRCTVLLIGCLHAALLLLCLMLLPRKVPAAVQQRLWRLAVRAVHHVACR
jgi:hypothetical protein